MADLDPTDSSSPGLAIKPEQAFPILQDAPKHKACFQIDTRDKSRTLRRQHDERRQSVRFETDRRSGEDRRPHKPGWELGVDI